LFSTFHPIATNWQTRRYFSEVPQPDSCTAAKGCKVTGVYSEQDGSDQYIEGLIAVDIDTLQWGTVEPKRLGDPALSE
jgi:hypothetical protein